MVMSFFKKFVATPRRIFFSITVVFFALFLLITLMQEFYIAYRVAKYNNYQYSTFGCHNDTESCEVTFAVSKFDSKPIFILVGFARKGKEHGVNLFKGGGGSTIFSGVFKFKTYYADKNTPLPNPQYNYFETNTEPMSPEVTFKTNVDIPIEIIHDFYKKQGRPSYRWEALSKFTKEQRVHSRGVQKLDSGK